MNLREREHKRKAKETKTFFVEGKRKKREKKKQKCFYKARESYRDTEDKDREKVIEIQRIKIERKLSRYRG